MKITTNLKDLNIESPLTPSRNNSPILKITITISKIFQFLLRYFFGVRAIIFKNASIVNTVVNI
jgi:hypothetical protein